MYGIVLQNKRYTVDVYQPDKGQKHTRLAFCRVNRSLWILLGVCIGNLPGAYNEHLQCERSLTVSIFVGLRSQNKRHPGYLAQ